MDSVTSGTAEGTGEARGIDGALRLDESKVRAHLDEVVRGTVEQTLNALLDARGRPGV